MATNAVSAMAVGHALGLETPAMATRIASYKPVGMRLRLEEGPGGTKLINDAYNANPMSVEANLRMLAAIPGRRRVALLGRYAGTGTHRNRTAPRHRESRGFLGTRPHRIRRPRFL